MCICDSEFVVFWCFFFAVTPCSFFSLLFFFLPLLPPLSTLSLTLTNTANNPIEDTITASIGVAEDGVLVGVFDGHSGIHAAKFCRDSLLLYVQREIDLALKNPDISDGSPEYIKTVAEALRRGFITGDEAFLNKAIEDGEEGLLRGASGACALVTFIDHNNLVFVANAGDSRAVLATMTPGSPLFSLLPPSSFSLLLHLFSRHSSFFSELGACVF